MKSLIETIKQFDQKWPGLLQINAAILVFLFIISILYARAIGVNHLKQINVIKSQLDSTIITNKRVQDSLQLQIFKLQVNDSLFSAQLKRNDIVKSISDLKQTIIRNAK